LTRSPEQFHTLAGFTRFYAPLAATGLLLTATNPLLTAAVARSSDPMAVLAGFTVAFSLCGVLYSPLLVIQQVAATRLLEGGELAPIRRFALVMGVFFSALAAAIAFTGALGDMVFSEIVGLEGRALDEAIRALGTLWPVPFLTAIRATHQGRLVAGHRTRPIARATGVRTAALAVVAVTLTVYFDGAWVGGAAFTVGLLVETVLVALARTPELAGGGRTPEVEPEELSELLAFSWPLMVNVLLWWMTPLVVNAVLARTAQADLNIAGFAIVEAVAWFIASPVGQLQHASIALVDCPESHGKVRPMAGGVAVVVFGVLLLLSFPGIRGPLLGALYGSGTELLDAAGRALPLAALYPLLYGHRQYFQGLYIRANHPRLVGLGAVLRVSSIIVAALLLLKSQGHHGAVFGVGLAAGGLLVEGAFLELFSYRHVLPWLEEESSVAGEAMSSAEGGMA